MVLLARLALFLGLPLRALLKWSVIKVFVLFLEETTVAGGRFSGTMVTSCVSIYVEDFWEYFFVEEMKGFCFGRVLGFMRAEWGQEKGAKIVKSSDSNRRKQREWTSESVDILSCVQVYGVPNANG